MVRQKDGFSGERSVVLPKMILDMMGRDPVMSHLHITDIGYYPKAANHYRERREPIDQYVFIYCVDGGGAYSVDGRSFRVEANHYFILPAGKPHSYGADMQNPWTIYWIHFRGDLAGHIACGAATPQAVSPGLFSRIDNRNALFDEILETLENGLGIENLRYAMSIFHHYLGSLRYIHQYRELGEKTNEDNVVEATIHYMKENIEKRITLPELSRFAGYSVSHLSTLFRTKTGHSPLGYCNLLKVQRACALIDNSAMKLNQICYKVGIGDPYYFSRFFSKIMGMSPRDYRRRLKT